MQNSTVDHTQEIIDGIAEIVAAEGPILALRAYQLYVVASGAQRVGTEMKRILNRIVNNQIKRGQLDWVRDESTGVIDRTLYLPGTPQVILRELGTRDLIQVPKSEVLTLIGELGLAGQTGNGVSRAVLEAYGLSRLGTRAAEFLKQCQDYRWDAD